MGTRAKTVEVVLPEEPPELSPRAARLLLTILRDAVKGQGGHEAAKELPDRAA